MSFVSALAFIILFHIQELSWNKHNLHKCHNFLIFRYDHLVCTNSHCHCVLIAGRLHRNRFDLYSFDLHSGRAPAASNITLSSYQQSFVAKFNRFTQYLPKCSFYVKEISFHAQVLSNAISIIDFSDFQCINNKIRKGIRVSWSRDLCNS